MFKNARLFLFVCAAFLPAISGCSAEADEELISADDVDFDALTDDLSLPNDLKGVKIAKVTGLKCNKSVLKKNEQASCSGSLPKTWKAEVAPFNTRYTVSCQARAAKVKVGPGVSIVSKDVKVGKSAKAVVKAQWDGLNVTGQVTVDQDCKITGWKKDAVQ